MRVRRRRRPLWRRIQLASPPPLPLVGLVVIALLTLGALHRQSADLRSVSASLQSVSSNLPSITRVAPPVPAVAPSPGIAGRLLDDLRLVAASTKAKVGIVVVDLRGSQPQRIELNGDLSFVAASTYKFPALMANAERIAAGTMKPNDRVCFRPSQAEDGWYDDYDPGECFTRQTIAARAATYSDNTAGHMLVDDLGGAGALNSYARSRGAAQSKFFYPNQTTASDLAALWVTEAQGRAGGQRAQQWLYPLLTKTAFETGIPAGVPASTRVVHKIGQIRTTIIDAGLVIGPKAHYALAIALDGVPGDAGWALVARFSKVVWQYVTR
jgi:beta-lactamase class A